MRDFSVSTVLLSDQDRCRQAGSVWTAVHLDPVVFIVVLIQSLQFVQ